MLRLPIHVMLALAGALHVASTPAHAQQDRADRALPWRLERLWSVGGAEDESLALTTLFAKDIATDGRGMLYVIDRTETRVVAYEARGNRVRTFGSRGKGPGELSAPLVIDATADGTVHVDDIDKGAIVVFGPDGKARPEYRLARPMRSMRVLASGAVVGLRQRGDSMRLMLAQGDSQRPLLALKLAPTHSTPPVCHLTDYPAPPIFAAEIVWAARGDRIASTTGGFRITIHEGETLQRVLTRDAVRRRSTPALARQHLGPGETMQILGERPCLIPADMILSVAEVASELPAYSRLAIAPDGRIWAMRFAVRGEVHFVDVYDPDRGYQGTVSVGSAEPITFLSSGELVSLEKDADDVPVIVVYTVKR